MGVEKTLLFFACLVTSSALVFALFSQYWNVFSFKKKDYNAGLWTVCSQEDDECFSYEEWLDNREKPSWLLQVRALAVIAATLSGIALLTSAFGISHMKIKSVYTSILQFLCAVLLAGAGAIFAEEKFFHYERKLISVHHHWGFYLTVGTSGWALIVTVFGIFADYCSCFKERTQESDYALYAGV